MNKSCYRVIFNKARGLLMAVAETVSSHGKTSDNQPYCVSRRRLISTVKPLTFLIWNALGMVFMPTVEAQIVVHPHAPTKQQPTIIAAPNGTSVVNIQTPSAAGVSRNTYNQFDVQKQGAILNNAKANAQTQLGGWIQGNANLAGGSARIILNEVNSSNPSRLGGYVEVAGQRAQVIIANPSGITCDGCGFINATRATLTTGTPMMNNGDLIGYQVQGGKITIAGAGMDSSTADYTDILARAVKTDAGLWAKQLNVLAGTNQINVDQYGNPSITSTLLGTDSKPNLAIDTSLLGGMYAGKINIIATEAGVGVRNAGNLYASAGDVVINANGQLENLGQINGIGQVGLSVSDGLNNTGTIYAQGNTAVVTQGDIKNSGTIAAQGNTHLTANGAQSQIISTKESILAAGIHSNGSLGSTGALHLNATEAVNAQGKNLSAADQFITAQRVDLSGSQTSARNLSITASHGDIKLTDSSLEIIQAFHADANQALQTDGIQLTANQVNLAAREFSNRKGKITAGDTFDIDVAKQITNTDGTLAANGQLTINAQQVDNQSGTIGSLQNAVTINVTGGLINNRDGYIGSQAALAINGASVIHNQAGQIMSNAAIDINAGALENQNGQIQSVGDLSLELADLNNTHGLVRSGQTLKINAASVDNSNTQGENQGLEGENVELNASEIDNISGTIRSNQNTTLTSSGTLNNTQGLISAGAHLVVQDIGTKKTLNITNTAGTLIASKQLNVDSGMLSGDGKVLSQGDLALNLTEDFTNTGQIMANGSVMLETEGSLTNQATLASGGNLQIDAKNIDNQQAGQITAANLTLSADDTLNNRGLVNAGLTELRAKTINNIGTGKIYGDRIAIDTSTLNNLAEKDVAAVIAARNRLDIGANVINNAQHAVLFSAGDMAIGRDLDANLKATGRADQVNNVSATIEALGNLDLDVAAVNNINTNFGTYTEVVGVEHRVEYQGSGQATRYPEGTPGLNVCNDESDHLCTPDGKKYEKWSKYVYTRTITETKVSTSDPAQILSGGAMRINADTVTNDKSRIIAGSTLTGTIGTLNNVEVPGTRVFTDVGTVTTYDRAHKKGRDETASETASYTPAAYIQAISLTPSVVQHDTLAEGSGTQVGDLNTGTVSQTPGSAGQPNGRPKDGLHISPIQEVEIPSTDGSPAKVIRTGGINTTVPDSSLYKLTPNPTAHYLIETDPAFANYRTWLSSDYMLNALALDPALTQKRLGDGFYEQKLIREQIAQLTGRRFLEGYASDEDQFTALMNNGVAFAKEYQLVPGVALSATQMAALTTDIVWLVEKDVTLPNGSTTKALVPQLYTKVQEGDLQSGGALVAGNNVNLNFTGDLINSGTIAGRQVVSLTAENINNLQGRILGKDVGVAARTDINNRGGTIAAERNLIADAGRDVNITSTTRTQTNAQGSQTNIDRVAGLYVTNPQGGALVVNAGRDTNLNAAAISNQSGGDTAILAKGDINLGTVTQGNSNHIVWNADNQRKDATQVEVGSVIQTQGKLNLQAGNDINARGANVTSAQGDLIASAGRNINLTTATANAQVDEAHQRTESGFLSSTTITTRDTLNQSTTQASTFSGKTATLVAQNDINVIGSNVVSDNGTLLAAKNDINIVAATSTTQESHYRNEETSGLFGSGGIGFTIGTKEQSMDQKGVTTSASGSVVGSTHGDTNIQAGHHYTQTGSDVVAPKGDVNIYAKRVDINEARETNQTQTENKFKQSGLTVAVTSPVISAIQTVQQISEAAGDTTDPRMHALAAASGALSIQGAANAISAGQGSTIDGKANQIATGKTNPDGTAETRDASAADKVGGVNLSISVGASSSESQVNQNRNSAKGSNIVAGKNLNIVAHGAGQDSDITIQGANIKVGGVAVLDAEDQINLLAAKNTAEQHSTNSSMSGSLGISIGSDGLLVTASASGARGNADGNDVTWSNTHLNAGKGVVLLSGGDTTLRGAVVEAEKIGGKIGGNLNIESLQDTSQFDSEQKSIGGSISVGYGKVGGNVNFSNSNINNDYASVAEQSGLRAGDGGFQIDVKGNTDLKGGAITSTQKAIDTDQNQFNTGGKLTVSDIQNHANFDANAAGVNLGTGVSLDGGLVPQGTGAGIGSDSGQAASTAKGAISGVAGNTAARTGDAETALQPIFDLNKVQKEINAQVKITQTVGQQAGQAISDYANKQRAPLQEQLKAAKTDDERKAIQNQINEVSMQERALNVLLGAVTGMGGTALTRETLQAAADTMRQLAIEDSRKFPGITDGETTLTNMSGPSDGVRGSGEKAGGTRVDLDKLCGLDNKRCVTFSDGSLKLNDKNQVQFKPEGANGSSLKEYLESNDGKEMGGLTGGIQGWEGTLAGWPYKPGDMVDKAIEFYAGSHDQIGGKWAGAYDDDGTTKRGRGFFEKGFHEGWSATGAIVVATPFAMAEALPPEVWKAISLLLGAVK